MTALAPVMWRKNLDVNKFSAKEKAFVYQRSPKLMTPVLGLYQEKHGLIDPWFVPPAMALGVRQILLSLQGSNWRKAKPRNEVKWRSRGGSLEDAPRLQTTHKSGNWNA